LEPCSDEVLSPVKIRIEDITADAKEITFSEPSNQINDLLEQGPVRDYVVNGPIEVELSYYRAGLDLFFRGEVAASVRATCARCAEEFRSESTRLFRFVLAPRVAGDREENALRSEDLEFSLYDGEEIELSPLIREQVLLALPTRPLCSEDCRGLCSICGANLNDTECACRVEPHDPRLAIFRSLKVERF
jgi:uncharacterized protein